MQRKDTCRKNEVRTSSVKKRNDEILNDRFFKDKKGRLKSTQSLIFEDLFQGNIN